MLCLQVSVLIIIHWRCFQVSYARAQLAKQKIEFASKRTLGHFPKKSLERANNPVKKLVIYYNITTTLCKSFCDVITRVRY